MKLSLNFYLSLLPTSAVGVSTFSDKSELGASTHDVMASVSKVSGFPE